MAAATPIGIDPENSSEQMVAASTTAPKCPCPLCRSGNRLTLLLYDTIEDVCEMVEKHPLLRKHHEAQALIALGVELPAIEAVMMDENRDTSKLWQGISRKSHCLRRIDEEDSEEGKDSDKRGPISSGQNQHDVFASETLQH